MTTQTIVLGAGLAGLAAAGMMRAAGRDVLVLEKSRGLGGRAATRRWDNLPVDHGAQFFTARSEAFRAQVEAWVAEGICHEWCRGFHQYRDSRLLPPEPDGHPRYVCRLGMSSLGAALAAADGSDVRRQSKVVTVRVENGRWVLACEDGNVFHAHTLVLTCPPPQGAELLAEAAPSAAELLRGITMHPCLAAAARFPRRPIPWHGVQSDDDAIAWIGHDTSKRPDLHDDRTIVMIHASPEFSRAHYGEPEHEVLAALLARAAEISGEDWHTPDAVFLQRWRYAMPARLPDGAAVRRFEVPAPLILAGEAFAGGKIEGAWISGRAAAEAD